MFTKKAIIILLISFPLFAGKNNGGLWVNYGKPIQKKSKIANGKLNFVIENNYITYAPQKKDAVEEIDENTQLGSPIAATEENKKRKWFGYSVDHVRDNGATRDSRELVSTREIRKNNSPQKQPKTRSQKRLKKSSIHSVLIPEEYIAPKEQSDNEVIQDYITRATNQLTMLVQQALNTTNEPQTNIPSDYIE